MSRSRMAHILIFIVMAVAVNERCASAPEQTFSLRIIHLNDTHSHLEPVTLDLQVNGEETSLEVGGYPRIATLIKEISSAKENILRLHAGDAVLGTLYFNKFEGKADAEMLNAMNFDVLLAGNHEFDKGPAFLADFMNMLDIPMISANVDVTNEPKLADSIAPFHIKNIAGKRVAIVGVTAERTGTISKPGKNVQFNPPEEAVRRRVKQLRAREIKRVVVLSHCGLEKDRELAQIPGVDVVIGGHSHTLFMTNAQALGLQAETAYPLEVQQSNKAGERTTCMGHAWEAGKAVGMMKVVFNYDGEVIDCDGRMIIPVGDTFRRENQDGREVILRGQEKADILEFIQESSSMRVVAEDPHLKKKLRDYQSKIRAWKRKTIAEAAQDLWHVRVPGSTHSEAGKLSRGSLIAPLVCNAILNRTEGMTVEGAPISVAVLNAGGVRADIPQGNISVADVHELLPFENTLITLPLKGKALKAAITQGVRQALSGEKTGAFPYVAGMRYKIGVGTSPAEVTDFKVKRRNGWKTLKDDKVYGVVTNSFLADGGDGYTQFERVAEKQYDTGFVFADVFTQFARDQQALSADMPRIKLKK